MCIVSSTPQKHPHLVVSLMDLQRNVVILIRAGYGNSAVNSAGFCLYICIKNQILSVFTT